MYLLLCALYFYTCWWQIKFSLSVNFSFTLYSRPFCETHNWIWDPAVRGIMQCMCQNVTFLYIAYSNRGACSCDLWPPCVQWVMHEVNFSSSKTKSLPYTVDDPSQLKCFSRLSISISNLFMQRRKTAQNLADGPNGLGERHAFSNIYEHFISHQVQQTV